MAFQASNNDMGGRGGFTVAGQRAKVKALFSRANNLLLFVGQIISRSMAEDLKRGESIEESSVVIDGAEYPLRDGFSLSLSKTDWMCPICNSAHGTARGVSKQGKTSEPSVNGLMANRFYYNPVTRDLFVLSSTCFDKWVVGDGYKRNITATPPQDIVERFSLAYAGVGEAESEYGDSAESLTYETAEDDESTLLNELLAEDNATE